MSRRLALAITVLAACGDDGGSVKTDAGMPDMRQFDAPPGFTCDYTEQSDMTNDTSSAGGVTESTGITFGTRTILCGQLDHTHFEGGFMVDGDSFTLTATADTDLIVRILAPGAQMLQFVGVDVYNMAGAFAGGLTFYGNHGVVSVRVPAGSFEILPFALHDQQITASVPYQIEIVADMPDMRCPEVTVGGYTEANDTMQDNGNDVLAYPMGSPVALTASTTDAPEPTNIVLAADVDIRIQGEAANIAAADKYEDTDTYEIATATGTNELAIRLAWPTATGADLDWHLYEQNTTVAVGSAATMSTTNEIKLIPVKPSTTYWLAVSAVVGTTVPADYNATLCPSQYTLPQ